MRWTVGAGMVAGTVALALLTRVDAGSTYSDFVPSLVILGLAIGLALSPCTDAIMGAFPESELGVGGAVNDTSLELGGSLGIAILGSLLATSYDDHLTSATKGSGLPADALATAQDSVGAGYAVAQAIGEKAQSLAAKAAAAGDAQQAAQLKQQAASLATGAHRMADAVGASFSDAVAHTSLIGAVILGIGTVVVAVLLPGREMVPPAGRRRCLRRGRRRSLQRRLPRRRKKPPRRLPPTDAERRAAPDLDGAARRRPAIRGGRPSHLNPGSPNPVAVPPRHGRPWAPKREGNDGTDTLPGRR